MTLQQLEYVLAVSEYQQFVKAAEVCGITQSTLSSMIKKLEDELDLVIFDRNSHPVKPTLAGENIIRQARIVLYHAHQLQESTLSERQQSSGHIKIGVTPTIAPYIIPKLFQYIDAIPELSMSASELHRDKILKQLKNAELDKAIISLPHKDEKLLEIPLYHETFFAFVSPKDPLFEKKEICSSTMPRERMWTLKHEISFQLQVSEFCDQESERRSHYEAGNISTLLHIVRETDGFTAIPELHIPMLRGEDLTKIRPLVNPVPKRLVSLFVRKDYVREKLLNIIADGIKQIVPNHMLDEHLKKYPIRL